MQLEPGRFVFRYAGPDDVPSLTVLDKLLFEHHSYPEDVFSRFIEGDNPAIIVEDGAGGDMVGFTLLVIDQDEGTGALITLDVEPAWWRKGVGSALVGACARVLLNTIPLAGLLWLTVASHNEGAISFYRALGFGEVGSIPNYYRDDNAIVMLHEDVPSLADLAPPVD